MTESLALGKPCVISNRTSLPEAGGSLARYFDPEDVADAIIGLLASRHVTGQDVVIDGGKSLTYD